MTRCQGGFGMYHVVKRGTLTGRCSTELSSVYSRVVHELSENTRSLYFIAVLVREVCLLHDLHLPQPVPTSQSLV